ncbi:rho GTPase-activating protein gacV-like [Toxorhynchites rutilus septentrionalis]|uniref:rho GTPase-activating protein gacV-like n=1 Tax=Toxorhynchites rutilus septentrionalis TaxID=329112 RepID=UPI00247AC207|nr:rho GTPase-activating protein gacV-like [Toxorhynchites rutilus septentrionalis]
MESGLLRSYRIPHTNLQEHHLRLTSEKGPETVGSQSRESKVPKEDGSDWELLNVSGKYFERLLGPTLRLQWQQTREAMKRFQFFDNWTDLQVSEMCILAKIKSYERQQNIYMPKACAGNDYAYFVLSGECMILQCLKVLKKKRGKRVCYRLLPAETVNYEIGFAKRSKEREKREEEDKLKEQEEQKKEEGKDIQDKKEEKQKKQKHQEKQKKAGEQEEQEGQNDQEESEEQKEQNEQDEQEGQNEQENRGQVQDPSAELEHHFIDVGTYGCGSVFGLGERLDDRSVVARERVHCMLVPRYWLFMSEQNVGNVWARIKMYLDSTIPSREQLFKQFLGDLNWVVYRKKVVADLLQSQRRPNHTHLLDVPLICRVKETMDKWK